MIVVNQSFSSDTIINPFTGSVPVYSLSFSGSVELLSDSSLIRIILIDTSGSKYMLFESYPLITHSNTFDTISASDETTFLDGVVCDSLKIDIINAVLDLDSLKLDINFIPNVIGLQQQAKWDHDSIKISIVNQRIEEENMYWRAGRTSLVELNFGQKELVFGSKLNFEGLDYYKGGIFENLSKRNYSVTTSTVVPNFDWRNRHKSDIQESPYFNLNGFGWITSVKNQDSLVPTRLCYVFSPVAAVEARANLVYNIHPNYPDLNISETEIWKCSGNNPYNSGGFQYASFNKLKNSMSVKEPCFPFTYNNITNPLINCSHKCTDPNMNLCQIEATEVFPYNSTPWNEDELKKYLITKGPVSCLLDPYGAANNSHYMVLVGYISSKIGDIVYKGTGPNDPDIIIDAACPFLNGFSWIWKNSYGGGANGFLTRTATPSFWATIIKQDVRVPTGMVDWYNHSPTEIKCTDEDGDGYYWWGLGLNPSDCNCPPGVKETERDCNDWDVEAGPYETENPPLYSCTQNDCSYSSEPLKIEGTQIWTNAEGDRHYNQDIVIMPGATLTIKCQVFMVSQAKIIVKPHGLLILEGTFTNPAKISSRCGELWKGVQLFGDPTLPQTFNDQGAIQITHGIIENAVCGIMSANPGYYPDGGTSGPPNLVYPSGGIIQAFDATFRNNHIGIEFFPYRDANNSNLSFLHFCRFITDDALLSTSEPYYFLKLDGINKLEVQGCSFQNTRDGNPQIPFSQRGRGIYLYNSSIYLNDSLIIDLLFENLEYGIYGMSSGTGDSRFTLRDGIFNNNKTGVYLSGYSEINQFEISGNEFNFGQNYCASKLYGLYFDNCSGFKVTLNEFDASGFSYSNEELLGIIINNSGAKTNYIYNNKMFKNLTCGILGQNVNRGYYTPKNGVPYPWPVETGLRFVCNDFSQCINDIVINKTETSSNNGIAYYQRNIENPPDITQKPAGNTFSLLPSGSSHLWDINIDGEVGNIQYMYHTQPENGQTIRLKPDLVSNSGKVSYDDFTYDDYDKASSCKDDFYPSKLYQDLRSCIDQANQKIDSICLLLRFLIDDGSTDTLKDIVENSSPVQSYDTYQDLMGSSPYLSDTVIQASILNESALPNAMIRDIMVANPQSVKNDELLETLENRVSSMPDSLWAEILAGQDTVGALERLKSELSGWVQKRDIYFNSLIELFRYDTTYVIDSLIGLLQNDFNLISRYNLISLYLSQNNFTQALLVLQNISSEFTLKPEDQVICQDFTTLIPIISQLSNDTFGYIIPDSITINSLLDLSLRESTVPGAYARNILLANGLIEYDEPVLLETTLKSYRSFQHYWQNIEVSSELKIYPNPCKDYIIIEFQKQDFQDMGLCNIINSNGVICGKYGLPKTSNQFIIPLTNYPSGIYFIQLQINGFEKDIKRFIKIN